MIKLINMANTFKSIGYAFKGISLALKQRSLRIAVVAGLIAFSLGIYFQINETEWLLILLIIGNIFTAEIINSSIENLSDKDKQLGLPYKDAGTARDLAAGAVLFQVIISVVIGLVIFFPKILEKFY